MAGDGEQRGWGVERWNEGFDRVGHHGGSKWSNVRRLASVKAVELVNRVAPLALALVSPGVPFLYETCSTA